MKNSRSDLFTQLKKEDRQYGEKTGKQTAKDHQKRAKHPQAFKNMRPSDLATMEDSFEYDEEYEVA
jgi:hypothetical protein